MYTQTQYAVYEAAGKYVTDRMLDSMSNNEIMQVVKNVVGKTWEIFATNLWKTEEDLKVKTIMK